MAKMFYTLEETASKLKKSPDEVRAMAQSGQLQEFRDRDKLVFKKEQVDLLSGGKDDDMIALADSGEITLASDDSGSGAPAAGAPTKERSGISIFEADEGDDADPMAQTQITAGMGGGFGGDAGSSGSGLLGMTQEADDTSLGAGLLDDVYGGKGAPGGQGSGDADAAGGEGGGALFESGGLAESASGFAAAPMAMMAAEPYDGAGSGLVGGLALGMVVVLALMTFTTVLALMGVPGAGFNALFASSLWMYVGIFAGVTFILGGVGWALGRKS
jgi:hypothetical protein